MFRKLRCFCCWCCCCDEDGEYGEEYDSDFEEIFLESSDSEDKDQRKMFKNENAIDFFNESDSEEEDEREEEKGQKEKQTSDKEERTNQNETKREPIAISYGKPSGDPCSDSNINRFKKVTKRNYGKKSYTETRERI